MKDKAKKYAVIGNPIEHSLSPIIHDANFKALQLKKFAYEKISVEDIFNVRNVALQNQICGFNVTLPWKEEIIPMLDEVHLPAGIQAVNTVAVDLEKKFFVGYNTDIYGILQDFKDKQIALNDKKMLILGYGGLGKTLAAVFRHKGTTEIFCTEHQVSAKRLQIKSVTVANRSMKSGVDVVVSVKDSLKMIQDFDVVINTTSIHSLDNVNFIDCISCNFKGIFYDCSPMQTEIVDFVNAKTNGQAYDGRGMLIHQAAKSFEIWTGIKADVNEMKRALNI